MKLILKSLLLILLLSLCPLAHAQTGTVKGRVIEKGTHEGIYGAVIQLLQSLQGTITNVDGEFLLAQVPVGFYDLRISAVAFETTMIPIIVSSKQDTFFNVELSSAAPELLIPMAIKDIIYGPCRWGSITESGRATIVGRIMDDSTNSPLSNVEISVLSRYVDGAGVHNQVCCCYVKTDSSGHYEMLNLAQGTYELGVHGGKEYENLTKVAPAIHDSIITFDIVLKRKQVSQ